jgi:hypothetical protein
MRRFVVVILFVLAGMVMPLWAQQQGPSIQFDSLTKMAGKAIDGEFIVQVFKYVNKGDAQLEILAVEPSCGCTSAMPTPNKLAPGQSGQIEIKVTTTGMAAASRSVGDVYSMSKTVTIKSNDSRQPEVVLTINANIFPEIAASEPSIFFGSNPYGKEITKTFFLEIAPDRPTKILGVASTDENVTAKLEPVAGSNGKRFKVIAIQKSTAAEGIHFGDIVITTSSKLKPEFKLLVRGIVTKGLE